MLTRRFHHFRTEDDGHGIVTVWIEVEHRSMNVFNDDVLGELEVLIRELEADASLAAVVFRSARPAGFIAGADVHQIAMLTSEVQAHHAVALGHRLFDRLEKLRVPTVAVIHGPCLGGGLEFALACRHRIAIDLPSTQLGLPEIRLGLIPGWGGTQRLPRLIGLTDALPMILTGSPINAEAALRKGLVDAVTTESSLSETLTAVLQGLHPCRPDRPSAIRSRLTKWFLNRTAPGRHVVLRTARKRSAGEAIHYPAINAALTAVAAAFDSRVDGKSVERAQFSKLIPTPTCHHLINLFLWREKARSAERGVTSPTDLRPRAMDAGEITRSVHPQPGHVEVRADDPAIRTLGVIGAGAMGAGIAMLAARKGLTVIVKELNDVLVANGRDRILEQLTDLISRGRMSAAERDDCLRRMLFTSMNEPLRRADIVIEAVVERMDVKRAVFRDLDQLLRPDAILASNTSALSVTHMSTVTQHPDRVAGLHFFNPVHRMDLVEIVRTPQTSRETVQTLVRLAKTLGKTPVLTTDTPGFLVNRVLFPYLGEAIRMVMEGANPRDLDREIRRFGMPMGPIELIDHVGIDIAAHVAGTLREILPDSDVVIRLLEAMVHHGRTGRKSGRGFYEYKDGRPDEPADLHLLSEACDAATSATASSVAACDGPTGMHPSPVLTAADRFASDGMTETQRRLIYPLLNEAVWCLQEGVVEAPWMVDLAVVLGTGFAPFHGGPLSLIDSIGPEIVLNNMGVLTAMYGERFQASAVLAETAGRRETLFPSVAKNSSAVSSF
ncbi:MAG: enoyl-CoA hydratase/isomerase family protein [Planctomycetaceae bacterium]|nr:enoyl-CoA hydratase/isomerase family protein [Planctomycetaceae bacterium]